MTALTDPALLEGVIARAVRPDFGRFEPQLRSSGYCARPVRLRGSVHSCDGRPVWSTRDEPDGILRKACGNRREAVCRPCAERYRQDAYHLIAAGLRGGKGVPDSAATHPAVFVTLTAPSFGPVHTRRHAADGRALRCRPRRDAPVCPHGVLMSCGRVHDEGDECLGKPICPECFDYPGAVTWNNAVGELWRRTTIYLPRTMARLLGITQRALHERVRFSYVKTSEYHQRSLVHLHAVIRLDRAMPTYRASELRPPSPRYTADVLAGTVRATVRRVAANLPDELGGGQVRWGTELELRVIGEGLERSRTAGYLAKYTTKSTEQAGGLLHRVAEDEVDRLAVSDHVRRYLRNAFELHHRVGPERRLATCAHAFGHRGHCLTKSRRYSTTFTALRKARERHVRGQLLGRCGDDAQRALVASERIASFRYVGQGHLTTADAFLAASAAARAREQRRAAGEALATAAIDQQTTEGRTDGDRLCSRDKSAAGRPRDRAADDLR
jgi:hypothetical protein